MEERKIDTIINGADGQICDILKEFNSKYGQVFDLSSISTELKQKMVEALFQRLGQKASTECYISCLVSIRILSRDKEHVQSFSSRECLNTLLHHSGILEYAEQVDKKIFTLPDGDMNVTVEAQKCLCNILFNSPEAQLVCSKNGCINGIVQRLKTYKDPGLIYDIKFFDMRLLFLLTALQHETRSKIRYELHGFTYLMEVIDLTKRDAEEHRSGLTDQEVDLCCEILKILFNLTVDKLELDEEEEAHFMRLVSILHDLLITKTSSLAKQDELQNNIVNLLINMPHDCFEELLTPLNDGSNGGLENKEIEFDGKTMEAIVVLLGFLMRRLEKPTMENLSPILHCLCETSRANRAIRKFCRSKVLPPLGREVKHLPEEGVLFRNRLCKLLTSSVIDIKELSAELLFILCKESVDRMVKYTGYGNCSGLLANRGLLCGNKNEDSQYSSDSEDSDTEDYSNLRDMVNPVTGRWELDKPDPLSGMTDEQKEYETMQLVATLDKLQRQGIIQPSKIGPDGKPRPVDHILEMISDTPDTEDDHSD